MIKHKLTLEQRISRLEKVLNSNRKSRKFESLTTRDCRAFKKMLRDMGAGAKIITDGNMYDVELDWEYFGIQHYYYVIPREDGIVVTDEDGDELGVFETLNEAAECIVAEDEQAAADL